MLPTALALASSSSPSCACACASACRWVENWSEIAARALGAPRVS